MQSEKDILKRLNTHKEFQSDVSTKWAKRYYQSLVEELQWVLQLQNDA